MKPYGIFAALIYATDVEEQSVMKLFDWTQKIFPGDNQVYYETDIPKDDHTVTLAAVRQPEVGMTAAAILSMKLIERYRPRYLIMPGIAAGVNKNGENSQIYGDVVLATKVWNYSYGKYVMPENGRFVLGNVGYIPRPCAVEMTPALASVLQSVPDRKDHKCHVQLGAIASSSKVIANHAAMTPIYHVYSDTKGVDMEAYGVASAARESSEPRPHVIIAKGICDFADGNKNDTYQQFASFTSCQLVRYLIEKILPETLPFDEDGEAPK